MSPFVLAIIRIVYGTLILYWISRKVSKKVSLIGAWIFFPTVILSFYLT